MSDNNIEDLKNQAEELIKTHSGVEEIHQDNGRVHFFTEFDALNGNSPVMTVDSVDDISIPIQFIPKTIKAESGIPISTTTSYCVKDGEDSRNPYARLLERIVRSLDNVKTTVIKSQTGIGFSIPKDKSAIGGTLLECLSVTPVWVMILDIRPDSRTNWDYSIVRMGMAGQQTLLWIPKGFVYCAFSSNFLVTLNDQGSNPRFKVMCFPEDASIIRTYSVKPTRDAEMIKFDTMPLVNNMMNAYMEDFNKNKTAEKDNITYNEMQLLALFKTGADGIKFDSDGKDGVENLGDFYAKQKNSFETDKSLWYR